MDIYEFFRQVCYKLGWDPTDWRLNVFLDWARQEGMPFEQTWNPLATTRLSINTPLNGSFNIGYGAGNWNSVPVRVYMDPEGGINATVETLALDYYINVRRCFQDQEGYDEAIPELATYVGNWAYGAQLVQYMKDTAMGMTPQEREEIEQIKRVVCEWGIPGNLQNLDMQNVNLYMYIDQLNSVLLQLKAALSQQGVIT